MIQTLRITTYYRCKINGETIYINIDNNTGDFYCKVPKFALEYMDAIRNSKWKNNLDVKNNEWCVITKTFDNLNAFLNSLNVYLAPKSRSYPVIQYAINEQVVKSLETGNISHLRNLDMLVLMKKD